MVDDKFRGKIGVIFFVNGYPASYEQRYQKKKQSFYLLRGEIKKLHRKISILGALKK